MRSEIIQIRDVPGEDVDILRRRAAGQNKSLSAYLRDLIRDDTSRPTMDEVVQRISTRDAVEVSGEDIRSFVDEGRAG